MQVTAQGSQSLMVMWDFHSVVSLPSLQAYLVTCYPLHIQPMDNSTTMEVPAVSSISATVHSTANSIQLHGLEVNGFEYRCCVTAQQLGYTDYRACVDYSTLPVKFPVLIIAGIAVGTVVIIVGVVVLSVIAFFCRRKR